MLLSDVRRRLLGRRWGSVVVDSRLGGRNAGRRKGLFFFFLGGLFRGENYLLWMMMMMMMNCELEGKCVV